MAEKKKMDSLNLVIEQIKKQTKDPNAIMRLGDNKKILKKLMLYQLGQFH